MAFPMTPEADAENMHAHEYVCEEEESIQSLKERILRFEDQKEDQELLAVVGCDPG